MIPVVVSIVALVLIDLLVIWIFVGMAIRVHWRPIQVRFPPRPVAPDAVRRNFQRVRIGFANFGGCVHIAADSDHLHLLPTRFLRMFGAGAASIDWSEIEAARRRGRWAQCRVTGKTLLLPEWCLVPVLPQDADEG